VIQVVTDSAAACKAAGKLIETKWPHITWSPCTAHCLDLFLEDIGRLQPVKDLLENARLICKTIGNHHRTHALFTSLTDLSLLRPCDTRFGTNFIMLSRMLEVRKALEQTVSHEVWDLWVDSLAAALRDVPHEVKSLIHDSRDGGFWSKIQELVDIMAPVMSTLRLFDGNMPVVGKVYWACFKVIPLAM